MAETINSDDTIINDLEKQFNTAPDVVEEEVTMLDVFGVECPAPESTDVPLAPTATAFTDN
jgi:hypothetical protein